MSNNVGKFGLRATLVVPFVLQIFVAVGLVGYLSFRNGQKAVNNVASQLRREVAARVQVHLTSYLAKPHLIDRKSTRLNSSHRNTSRMPSSA